MVKETVPPERTVMDIMGWSSTAMAARYQHVTDPIRREVAARVGTLLWASNDPDKTQSETRAPNADRTRITGSALKDRLSLSGAEVAGFEPARGLCPQPA